MAEQGDQEQSYEVDYSSEMAAMQDAQQQLASGQAMSATPLASVAAPLVQSSAMQSMADAKGRMEAKAQLAEAVGAGNTMMVDPDQVDKLAGFFDSKAQELRDRRMQVRLLADVQPPGTDPVSSGAARVYSKVGEGDEQAYLDNYSKLIQVFEDASENLKSTAQQTRSDEQGAKDRFRA
ncbi:hypothetical protein GIY23_09265 [Allosaccharopolyspora coralli]|uniref:PE domain-containing protein n=1 Tax=Allosaccharopolyspora coralli TaxID=2665642 RepID=A0A5Q3Q5R2_9PSEU|nr:hypothetical protein [Allosaccharopolyspora coralli]QGK69683.1 hypothetical protein GIY23_09265 [Allosaccharopolyspora coralli]